jgi:hypothetical protein
MVTGKDFEAVSQLGRLLTVEQHLTLMSLVVDDIVLEESLPFFEQAKSTLVEFYDNVATVCQDLLDKKEGIEESFEWVSILAQFEFFLHYTTLCEEFKKLE